MVVQHSRRLVQQNGCVGAILVSKGTLTKVGWMWKCFACSALISVASDNVEPFECPQCGGYLFNAPVDEAKKEEQRVLANWRREDERWV